jgi:hypothetical protein
MSLPLFLVFKFGSQNSNSNSLKKAGSNSNSNSNSLKKAGSNSNSNSNSNSLKNTG